MFFAIQVNQWFAISEALRLGRDRMLEPQDLPGRFGRVVRAIDRLLELTDCPAVVGGGWAVWRHGYAGRLTQDVDIVLPADRLEDVLRVASVSGFDTTRGGEGRWPKLYHKQTDISVDILPEGGRPGTASQPAPTTIPHPSQLGAIGTRLRYVTLPALLELKIAAGRARDQNDVIELLRANPAEAVELRDHLASVHADYVTAFDKLLSQAQSDDQLH